MWMHKYFFFQGQANRNIILGFNVVKLYIVLLKESVSLTHIFKSV